MDDLRERMEQLARRVDGAAAPDLQQVRDRHTRRRTRSALVVGLCIAVVGAFAASRVLRNDDTIPADEGSLAVVWPQDDGGAWQADPVQVVERFGQVVLGWSQPDIISYEPGVVEMRPEACPPNARCMPSLTLTVEETRAGIWSVTSVTHPQLEVATGDTAVRFDLTLADDRSAHVGVVATNGCRNATAFEVGLDSGPFALRLPDVTDDDPSCDDVGTGYAFAYVTDDTTVPVGDPLLEAAAIEYPWLTVIPISFLMEADAPDVLTVSCYGGQLTTVGRSVLAQPDGVHLLIEGQNRYVEVSIDHDLRRIEDAPREVVLPLEPGEHTVECILPGAGQVSDPHPFGVLDPEGYWVDPSIDRAPPGDAVELDAAGIPIDGDPDDELLAAGEQFLASALSEPGSVMFGGYAASSGHRTVISVDGDGSVLGRVDFDFTGEHWFPEGFTTCEGQAVF